MADLATAYLRLIPSLKGAQGTIEKELSGINTKSTGDALGGNLGEGIKGGLGKIAIGNFLGNILTQGVEMAASAATSVFTQSFSESADFEQLAGGVETLFGESADKAMENAQKAFKTAGISANEYMEQVNSFAASLRQSLGPERAGELADYADRAVQDMADNANKMGTQMESIQNAYQGFAKQNYTMLDNLKLGYGGTKSEMERLLADASQLAGVQFNIESYSDVIDAIHVIQENMGITGTTADEAAHTVSGSIAMMQSAWTNLLAELGKPDGDIEGRVNDLITSIFGDGTEENPGVVGNVIPLIGRILESMGKAIGDFAIRAGDYFMEHRTEIYDKVGQFMQGALQAILTATPYIIEGIVYLVGSMLEYIVTHIPDMLAAGVQLLGAFLEAIVQAITPSMQAMNEVGQAVLDSIGSFINDMFNAGANLIQGFIDGILSAPGAVIDAIGGVVGGAVDEGKRLLGIASPSKVFAQLGEYSMQGYIQGVESFENATKNAVGGIMSDIAVSASVDNSSSGGVASPIINITVESRGDEDSYELGRRIGQATAYELRMQGVSA